MGQSVLDCPLQNHTSPTRTSFSTTSFAASTPPFLHAGIAPSSTIHLPLAQAFVSRDCPAKDTCTASPGSAVPHTRTGMSRCNTILSPNTGANATLASAVHTAANAARIISFFIASPRVYLPLTLFIAQAFIFSARAASRKSGLYGHFVTSTPKSDAVQTSACR